MVRYLAQRIVVGVVVALVLFGVRHLLRSF
jgi:hypothetical protein